ncbi:hypothetical protein MED121_01695 [Marinomonas sp. MED121]|nr:hypothetical protein MED121_01695 [Marinomonas sp. MED121]
MGMSKYKLSMIGSDRYFERRLAFNATSSELNAIPIAAAQAGT